MRDLSQAKTELLSGGYTCVIRRGQAQFTSQARGVRPLVGWYAAGQDFSGFCAADKVVGKATAFLYVLLGVRSVYALVISRSALDTLKNAGIHAEYDTLVENIINRAGDGICPFEQAVLDIAQPQLAYRAIRAKMEQMNIPLEKSPGVRGCL